MPKQPPKNPADYIVPLDINGLEGRMLRLPTPGTKQAAGREVLFVYGSHSKLERWWGVALMLNRYGALTMPDLPGFGGMDSFYKIHRKPTLDSMADYLAAFVKLRYRRKRVMIVGLSYGFVVATRMLQRYPELAKKVTVLVSIVGFAHRDDFVFSKPRYYAYVYGTRLLSHRLPAELFHHVALNPWLLRTFYGRTYNAKHKFAQGTDPEKLEVIKKAEVALWRENDVRTWARTSADFLRLDNCQVRVDLPVWQVAAKNDTYFNNQLVEQHLRVIYSSLERVDFEMATHAPSVFADEASAAALIPPKLRRFLGRLR
jgi:pimeloyl-ACP methyl ester carboxylesterase